MIEKIALTVPGGIELEPIAGMPDGGLNTFNTLIQWIVNFLFVGATVLALIFIIWGGIGWITSGGDKGKVDAARKKIVYAVIGLIVTFLAYFILSIIESLFGIKFFNYRLR
jgi:type IV secretory pathway VirB2 component (pilin)